MRFLSVLLSVAGASPASAPPASPAPTVRLWMNNEGRFREGEYVRVQVDAETDGFLLVLHYDPFGRLRVLFPLDPGDDNRVQAGRRYEVRDDGGRYAFRADGDGPGLLYSAISPDPWRFDEVVHEGRWDYGRLSIEQRGEDPEPDITELVQRLAGPDGFDYDVRDYRVYGIPTETSTTVVYRDYGYRDYGYDYYPYRYCDWYWSYSGCRSFRFGLHFGYYDPFYYGYYGYPYRSYGYYPYYPRVPEVTVPRVPRAVVSGRPRNYTVTPTRPRSFGSGAFDRVTPARDTRVTPSPVDWRSRAAPRPANLPVRGVTRGSSGPERGSIPMARPVRPAGERREFRGETRSPTGERREFRGGTRSPTGERREFRGEARGPTRVWSPPVPSAPRARPSAERSGGRRDPGISNSGPRPSGNRGGGEVRGSSGRGNSAPPAPSRPRRPGS